MRINAVNATIGTLIAVLLSWWLWKLGEAPMQRWLLATVGGVLMETGIIGSMGVNYANVRSGVQVKLMFVLLAAMTFIFSVVCSFFLFSPEAYCIPVIIFGLLCTYAAFKIYHTKE